MIMHMQKVAVATILILSLVFTAQAATMMFNSSGTGDGYWDLNINFDNDPLYIANVRGFTPGRVFNSETTISDRWKACSSPETTFCFVDRAQFQFNTSSIPDDTDVTSATVYIYQSAFSNNFASVPSYALYSFSPATNGTSGVNDFKESGNVSLTDTKILNATTNGGYVAFTLTDPTIVSKTAWTRFTLKNAWDAAANCPVWASQADLVLTLGAQEGGGSVAPYMVVTTGTTPVANFIVSSTWGYSPYTITFSDTSAGTVTGREWYYRNTAGGSDTLFNSGSIEPSHEFTGAGSYDIKLRVSNDDGFDWENQTDRITIYNMSDGITSKSMTLTYHSANGITWWEYGVSPTNLPFKTRNVSGVGVVSTTISGLPLLSGQTYYYRACTVAPYECTDVGSVVLAAVTPNPETTYGLVERNISESGFNLTELGPSLFEPMGWVTGQSTSIAVGIIMFFIMVAFWIRGRGVVIPIILGFIVSFLLISGAAYGTSIPPEFVFGAMIFASLGLTGITLMMFKR